MSQFNPNTLNPGRFLGLGVAVMIIFGVSYVGCGTLTTVNANEIVVKQNAIDGHLQVWSDPGLYNKWFGRTTIYVKSSEYSFSAAKDQGSQADQSIRVQFNDGGHGNISGTLRWELPTSPDMMLKLHSLFGTQEQIEQQLIRPAVERAMLATGPLMSSKESSASRRGDLLRLIEDQVINGVYKTTSTVTKVKDPFSGEDETVTLVNPVADPTAPGGYQRQVESPITKFGIHIYAVNINGVKYEDKVERQIEQQQELAMQVQTSMAKARQAEQEKITVEQSGLTSVAKAKYDAEVVKQKAVTEAEQKLAVQQLATQTAAQYKQEQTLIGEGDAARRAAVMKADNALDARLNAYVEVQKLWADALSKQRMVPEVMVGANSSNGAGTTAQALVDLMTAKTARDLSVSIDPGQPPRK